MQRITFTNSVGQSIVLGHTAPFVLSSIDGLGDVDAEIQSQKAPNQDGNTFLYSNLETRHISMGITILGTDVLKRRKEIASVFNPKLGVGVLRYENKNELKEIKAIPEHVPSFPSGDSRGRVYQSCLIDLVCPNPYWQSQRIKADPIFEPLFKFPFSGKFRMGYQRERQIILNDGDVSTPLYIELFGPAVAPKITNETTGEFIRVNRELSEGEHLRINTARGRQKSVIHVDANGTETNAFHWIDLDSTFFQLELGENTLVYSADSNIQGATVNIEYRNLYVGV